MININEILESIEVNCSSIEEFIVRTNKQLKGKYFNYKSNADFDIMIEFNYLSNDNFQVNGEFNPANCYCMEV